MNILYYTTFKPDPTKGGTERATISIAKHLSAECGMRCYSAYAVDAPTDRHPCFTDDALVSGKNVAEQVRRLVDRWGIDVLISQGDFDLPIKMRRMSDVQIVLAHHFEAGWETHFIVKGLRKRLCESRMAEGALATIKGLAKVLLGPLLNLKARRLPRDYHDAYYASDAVVLLSERHADKFRRYASLPDDAPFAFIPNALSYDEFATLNEIRAKEKVVLIVARMDEEQKRISMALDVWKIVKASPRSDGWRLDIVGHGDDLDAYREKVRVEGIPAVRFLGRKDSESDYKRASLFIMTSISEGWGITLTEAQQMGVVPVAFDSYPAVRDIIANGTTGLLFPFGDAEAMGEGLLSLMSDRMRRERMALAAVESSRRFARERVGKMWADLLQALCADTGGE